MDIGHKYTVDDRGRKLTGEIIDNSPGKDFYTVKWRDGLWTQESKKDIIEGRIR